MQTVTKQCRSCSPVTLLGVSRLKLINSMLHKLFLFIDDESRRAEPVGDDRKIHNVEEMRGGPAVLIQNTQNNVEAVRQEPEVINQNECLPSQPGTGGPVLNPGFLDSTPRLMIGSLDSDVCKNTTQPMNTNLPQVLPDDLVKAERCSKECGHIEFNELDPGTVSDRFRTREGPSGTSHLNEINNIEISLCILNSQNNEEEEIVKKTPVEGNYLTTRSSR